MLPLNAVEFDIYRISDRAVVDAVTKGLSPDFPVTSCNCDFILGGEPIKGLPGQDSRLDGVLAQETVIVASFGFALTCGITVRVRRQWNATSTKFTARHDVLTITPRPGDVDAGPYAKLIGLLRKHLQFVDEQGFLDFLKEEDRGFYEARERSLQRLQEMQEDFFRKLQDFTTHQAERYQAKQTELEQRLAQQEKELAAAHAQRAKELDERESALKKRAEDLDDRQSTHVRREIRKDLKRVLTERSREFELTQGTKRRRWSVIAAYVVLLVMLAGGACYYIFKETSGTEAPSWLLLLRQAVFTLAFATTAGFFIRWMGRWAQSHADEEFKLKRLELDIDRASWVVEHALEWRAEKGTEIPQYLLERLSRNLFAEESPDDSAMTAADALALAILRSSSSAKLRLGDAELNLSHKGIKDLGKTPLE